MTGTALIIAGFQKGWEMSGRGAAAVGTDAHANSIKVCSERYQSGVHANLISLPPPSFLPPLLLPLSHRWIPLNHLLLSHTINFVCRNSKILLLLSVWTHCRRLISWTIAIPNLAPTMSFLLALRTRETKKAFMQTQLACKTWQIQSPVQY